MSFFKTIKLGVISPTRVGHLIGELSLWYLENLNKNDKNLNIWFMPKKLVMIFLSIR